MLADNQNNGINTPIVCVIPHSAFRIPYSPFRIFPPQK